MDIWSVRRTVSLRSVQDMNRYPGYILPNYQWHRYTEVVDCPEYISTFTRSTPQAVSMTTEDESGYLNPDVYDNAPDSYNQNR